MSLKVYHDGWVKLPANALAALANPDSLVLVIETGRIMLARSDQEPDVDEPRSAPARPATAAPVAADLSLSSAKLPARAGAKPRAKGLALAPSVATGARGRKSRAPYA